MNGMRIWKTNDGRYVGDGHPDAVELVAGPADAAPKDFDLDLFESTIDTNVVSSATTVEPEDGEADDVDVVSVDDQVGEPDPDVGLSDGDALDVPVQEEAKPARGGRRR